MRRKVGDMLNYSVRNGGGRQRGEESASFGGIKRDCCVLVDYYKNVDECVGTLPF